MAMWEPAGERGDPLLITLGAAVAAAQHLHAEDADQVDRKPQRKAGIALFAEHLEIGAVIGARLVHLERLVDGLLRALTLDLHGVVADLVLAIRLEPDRKSVV